jgi:cytidine deaminase
MVDNMTIVKGRNAALTKLVEKAVKSIKSDKRIRDCGCATAFFTLDSSTIARLKKEKEGSLEGFEYRRNPEIFCSRGSSRTGVFMENARDNIQGFVENLDKLVKNLDKKDQPKEKNRNSRFSGEGIRNGFIALANRASETAAQGASFITTAVANMGHTRSLDIMPIERMFEQFFCMIHKAAIGNVGTSTTTGNLEKNIERVREPHEPDWNKWRWETINGLINQCRNVIRDGHARLMELAVLTMQMGKAHADKGIGELKRIITNCAEPMAIDFISSFQDKKRLVAVAYDLKGQYIKDPCENCREWILEGGSMEKLNCSIGGMIVGRRANDKPGDTLRFVSTLKEFKAIETARGKSNSAAHFLA